jgi:hypothetical protein
MKRRPPDSQMRRWRLFCFLGVLMTKVFGHIDCVRDLEREPVGGRRQHLWIALAIIIAILVIIILNFACKEPSSPTIEPRIVVQSYLIGGRLFDKVVVTKSLSFSDKNSFGGPPAISNAIVTISTGSLSYLLEEDTSEIPNWFPPRSNRGTYRLRPNDSLWIGHHQKYTITILASEGTASAETTVPVSTDPQILEPVGQIVFGGPEIRLKIIKDASIYGCFVKTKIDYGQPLNFDFGESLITFSTDSIITVPWSTFMTLGDTWIYVYGVDENYFQYFKTHKTGNPTQSYFQPTTPVNGGLGIVASASLDSIHVFIR